eukprot:Skav204739  [mRNA]  locus=scaffold1854:188678:192024:- [translate_table: standard]
MHIATAPHVGHGIQTKKHQEERPVGLHQKCNFLTSRQGPLVGDHSHNVQIHQVSKAILIPRNHNHLQVGEGQQDPADHPAVLVAAHHGGKQAEEECATHVHQDQWSVPQDWSIELDPPGHVLFLKGLSHKIRVSCESTHEERQRSGRHGAPEKRKELQRVGRSPLPVAQALACAHALSQGLGQGSHDEEHHHEKHLKDRVPKVMAPIPLVH